MFYSFVSVLPTLPKYYSGINKRGIENYTYRKQPINIEVLYTISLKSYIFFYFILFNFPIRLNPVA